LSKIDKKKTGGGRSKNTDGKRVEPLFEVSPCPDSSGDFRHPTVSARTQFNAMAKQL